MVSKPGSDVFVSCDWGSTSFRLRLVEFETRRVLAEQQAANGIKTFAALSSPERASAMSSFLADRLAAWENVATTTPIVISGMASSNVGWAELPYTRTPFPLDGTSAQSKWITFRGAEEKDRRALLISGVRTDDDIMRGEECALLGAHALRPSAFAAGEPTLVLLAGTHPKHATISNGVLISFRTHLTGELFDALSQASLLAASVDRTAAGTAPDFEQFRAGVRTTREHGASAALFQVRARSVLDGVPKAANTWFLSGILVGAELERLAAQSNPPRPLLVGDSLRVRLYREALNELSHPGDTGEPASLDLSEAMIAGQQLLLRRALEHTPDSGSATSR